MIPPLPHNKGLDTIPVIESRGAACPICRDPEAFPIWVEAWGPPWGCPTEPERRDGFCARQIERAKREADWRAMAPEAFDERGVIKPDGLARVLELVAKSRAHDAACLDALEEMGNE